MEHCEQPYIRDYISLPAEGSKYQPFKTLQMDWEPMGHAPDSENPRHAIPLQRDEHSRLLCNVPEFPRVCVFLSLASPLVIKTRAHS